MTEGNRNDGTTFPNVRHDRAREALADAVDKLTTTEGWKRWLECRAVFHHYSLNNTLLIMSQRPEATRVAGYKAWQKVGRQVRKGERGIAILAPQSGPCRGCDGEGGRDGLTCGRCGGSGRWLRFRAVHVFDVAQTDGEPLPEITSQVTGQEQAAHTLNRHLFAVAQRERLDIEFEDLRAGLSGYYEPTRGRIVLDLDMPAAQQASVLAHELAHHFDPEPPESGADYHAQRGGFETVAEAASFVACRAAGLDTTDASAGYVAAWADGDAGAVLRLAERIDKAATSILDRWGEEQAVPEAA